MIPADGPDYHSSRRGQRRVLRGGFLDHAAHRLTPGVLAVDHFGPRRPRAPVHPDDRALALAGQRTAESAAAMGLARGTPVSAGYAGGPAMLLALGIVDQSPAQRRRRDLGPDPSSSPHSPVTDGSILGCASARARANTSSSTAAKTSASTFEWFVDMLRPAGAEGGAA